METQNYIALAGKEISISVSVFLFKEENAYIAYCPSLDLSGYDATEDSAKQDFEYVLREWLREQMDNGTLYRDLAKHGWKVGQEKAIEPSVADMIRGNKSAGKIFSLPEFKKTNIHIGSSSADPWFEDEENRRIVRSGINSLEAGGGKIYTSAELKQRLGQ